MTVGSNFTNLSYTSALSIFSSYYLDLIQLISSHFVLYFSFKTFSVLQQQQHQQQQQQDQYHRHPDPSLNLTINRTIDPSTHSNVVSPHSHPVASHAVSSAGAAETIWGIDPESSNGRLCLEDCFMAGLV